MMGTECWLITVYALGFLGLCVDTYGKMSSSVSECTVSASFLRIIMAD